MNVPHNDFQIDLKGLFVLLTELSTLDLNIAEFKVVLHMMSKILQQSGYQVEINQKQLSDMTGLTRKSIYNAIESLKKKNLIYSRAGRVEFTFLTSVKTPNGWVNFTLDHTRELFSQLQRKTQNGMGKNSPYCDVLARAMFGATVTGEKGSTWVKITEDTPYIYIHNTRARTTKAVASSAAAFSVAQQIPFVYEDTDKAHGLTPQDLDTMIESGTIEIGQVSYAVLVAFYELGDFISIPRIHHVKSWLTELADIYKIETEKDIAWAKKIIFEWKMYYSDPDKTPPPKTPQDFLTTLTSFFANTKRKK